MSALARLSRVLAGRRPSRAAATATLVTMCLATACSSPITAPGRDAVSASAAGVPTGAPVFLRHDPAGPGFTTLDTSFVAVAGERATFRIFPAGHPNGSDRFLDFDLHDESLIRYPAGHPRAGVALAPGDTITITVRIDPVLLSVEMGPEGLQFDPDHPARLELGYRFADPDFDGDGLPDPELESSLGMYRQSTDGAPWTRLDASLDPLADRVKFDEVTSFSRYALAF